MEPGTLTNRFCLLLCALLGGYPVLADQPLTLLQVIEMPEVPSGPYADHMALDLDGHRLFTTPQASKSVDVLDLALGKVVRTIRGFGNPHAILYRADRNRLFVTDGDGAVRILDATSYREIKSITLERNADGIGYDARTGYIYVANGGAEAGRSYSQISIIDSSRETRIGTLRIQALRLEAMVIDPTSEKLYVNLPDENAIAVVDIQRRNLSAIWPLTLSKRNEAIALDEEHHWLYVGCNDGDVRGSILVIDTLTGKELQRLEIGSWVDSLFYDSSRRRIYASTGVGEVFTFERQSDGTHRALEPVDTAVMARTALFSPELDRLFVAVPQLGWTTAKVLVFKPQ